MTRAATAWHVIWAALVATALLFPLADYGTTLLALTGAYHVGLLAALALAGQRRDLQRWLFLAPLSMLMVLPDWVLVRALGVLSFPNHGTPHIGPVPLYMAGLWVVPLFIVTSLADRADAGRGWVGAMVAGWIGVLLFAAAEWLAPQLSLWAPRNVERTFGVAHYILPAQAWLSAHTWLAWRQGGDIGRRLGNAAIVMLCYTGAAAISSLFLR